MRGFRGSRAVQNEMAHRYGRHGVRFSNQSGSYGRFPQQQAQQRPPLPDWVKVPENKSEAKPAARAAAPQPQQRPELRMVVDNTKQKQAAPRSAQPKAAKPKAAKPKVASARKAKSAKPKTASASKRTASKRPAAKRKAA